MDYKQTRREETVLVGMDSAFRDVMPLARSGAVHRADVVPRGQMVFTGFLAGSESPTPNWDYNKLWSTKYRDQTDDQVKQIKELASTLLRGGFIDPKLETTKGVYRGTGRGLIEDYPWLKRVVSACTNGTAYWPLRKVYLEATKAKAILFRDGNALWKVKERYKVIYNWFKFQNDMLHTLTSLAIKERAADIEFDWKYHVQPTLQQNTIAGKLTDPAAWAAVAKDVAITVVDKAGKVIETGIEAVVPTVAQIGDTLAKETAKSIWRHPLFWITLGGGAFLLWKSGALRWIAGTGKTLVERRIGL